MRVIDTQSMRMLDQRTIHDYGVSSKELMKRAAMGIKEQLDAYKALDESILIICGPGNNGGDGFALAVLLHEAHYSHVHLLCDVALTSMSEDELFYARQALHAQIPLYDTLHDAKELMAHHSIVVDALFGTGLSRAITGRYETLIQEINASKACVISADMPSGVDSDTGCVKGCAVRADYTITFACLKKGQLLYPGSMLCGRLIVKDIGIPETAFHDVCYADVLSDRTIKEYLPKRNAHSHKGTYGKVLLVGGSRAMHGALTLCARGMLRSGVGTLTLFIPSSITEIQAYKMEECMLISAPDHEGYFAMEAVELLKERMHDFDMIVIGNGMGRCEAGNELVKTVLKSDLPCVLDGDALFACADHMELLKHRKSQTILTPHPKEMSYLTGRAVKEITSDSFHSAQCFINEYPEVVLVEKDQYTIIADKNRMSVNMAGNNALAKGGSGDVLCGIISALFAQGHDAYKAACCGVYVHASCGDELAKREDANSILPSDLIQELSSIYRRLR